MTWLPFGTIIPGIENFTPWGPPVQGGELFRVTQTWADAYPGYGYCHIVQRWDPEGTFTWDRIYPSEQPSLLHLPIPPEFRAGGLITRTIEGRLNSRARIPANANWAISLEVWGGPLPTVPSTSNDPASTDPGSYLNLDGGTYGP